MCGFSRAQPEGKGFPFYERILWPISLQSPDPVSLVEKKSFSAGALPKEIQNIPVFFSS